MGVEKRPDGTYRARYIAPDGRQRAKHFKTKKPALDWHREQVLARDRGRFVDPSIRTTVESYARQWVESRPHRPSTRRNVEGLLRNHLYNQPLAKRRLQSVRPSEVQAWATGRATVMSPIRLRNLVSLVRSMLSDAVLDGLMSANPATRVKLPRHDKARIVALSVEQVRALADAMPSRNRAMVIVQATTGVRIGELIALRVKDIDFLRRTLRVEYQFAPGSKTRSDPKTPRSRRTIPLPTVAAEAIAAHMQAFPPGDDGTLFVTRLGTPYRADFFGALLKKGVRKSELPEDTTSHDLRHHFASALLAAGESVVVVAERLGHANASIVLSTYAHMIHNAVDSSRRAIDKAWEASPGDTERQRWDSQRD